MSPNEEEYELILADLKAQIEEGHGETIYNIGEATEGIWKNWLN